MISNKNVITDIGNGCNWIHITSAFYSTSKDFNLHKRCLDCLTLLLYLSFSVTFLFYLYLAMFVSFFLFLSLSLSFNVSRSCTRSLSLVHSLLSTYSFGIICFTSFGDRNQVYVNSSRRPTPLRIERDSNQRPLAW